MTYLSKLVKSYFFYTLSAFSIGLSITANVGVSSYNAMNLAVATVADIRIGTVTIIFNSAFLLTYMILTQFKERQKYLIQVVSILFFGSLINFFTYTVLGHITDLTYLQRLMMISFGTILSGSSIGMIVHYNVITFPMENVCLQLSEKYKLSFVKLRYGIDIVSIAISLSLSYLYALPLFVREGTIISMILLSASMNFSKEYFSKREQLKAI